MKNYLLSLFPFRWVIVLIPMFLTMLIIMMGMGAEREQLAIGKLTVSYFLQYRLLWYFGNILFWIIADIFAGLGHRSFIFK